MNNSNNNMAPEYIDPCMRTYAERAQYGVLVAFAHSRFSDAHIELSTYKQWNALLYV